MILLSLKLRCLLVLSFSAAVMQLNAQTIYYSKSSGNLNLLATWGQNSDGSGTAPGSFTTANVLYVITNTSVATIGAAWTVSGTGSKIQVGDGILATEFIVPSTAALSGTVDVMNTASLTIQNASNPSLGNLSSGSTVNYARAGAQNVLCANYHNLLLSGGGQKSFLNTFASAVTNSLIIETGSMLRFHTSSTLTFSLFGTVSGDGTILGNNASALDILGTGDMGTLTFSTTLSLYSLSLNRSASGFLRLGSNLSIVNAFTHNDGVLALNDKLLSLNGSITFPASAANGMLQGSASSSLSVGNSTLAIANSLWMDQTTSLTKNLNSFVFNRLTQTLSLGNDLSVSGVFTQSAGQLYLNDRLLRLDGNITFPTTYTNGVIIGSASASLAIGGSGTIGNSLKIDQTNALSRTIHTFIMNRTGVTLSFGNNVICSGSFDHSNGSLSIGSTLLNLSGHISFPAAASNGSMTGSASSSLSIDGSGSIVNALYMNQSSTTARTLGALQINRGTATLSLGNPLIVSDYTQSNGFLSLNGTALTLNGQVTLPLSPANGVFVGSTTSSLVINTSTMVITNPLYMDQSSNASRSLAQFFFSRASQTLMLGSDLTVNGNFTHSNGNIDLNGKDLRIGGIITFPLSTTNGVMIGSTSSSVTIDGTGAITNSFKIDQSSSTNRSLSAFTLNHSGGTFVLGGSLICVTDFNHSNGPFTLGANLLTLNGNVSFPAAASNGSFTGSTTSSITIGGSGSLINSMFMSQSNAAARSLGELILNRTAVTLNLGNSLIVTDYTQTNGSVNLNGAALTLNGLVTLPASSTNGLFVGSGTSTLIINTSTSVISNPISMDQSNSASRTLAQFLYSRASQTLALGSDVTVNGSFTHSNGILDLNGKFLRIGGVIVFPATTGNGVVIGSPTSSLTVDGTGAITNTFKIDQSSSANRSLNAFTLNHSAGTFALGGSLICHSDFNHSNGPFTLGTNLLTLNGNVSFPAAATNGSFTGSTTSSINIGGSGSISNLLFMSQANTAARSLGELTLNRSAVTLSLGNSLIVTDYTQTNGSVNLNGAGLTLNGLVSLPASSTNGLFVGSATSTLIMNTSTSLVSNPLCMDQSSSASRSLAQFLFSRASQTLTLGSDLQVIGGFTHSNGAIDLNGKFLSIGGIITFPASSANGVFIGSTSSSLTIDGTGAITNSCKIDQSSSVNRSLSAFTLNHSAGTFALGGSLICLSDFNHANGPFTLGANLLTLNGNVSFPAAATNGSFTGSATSSITIGGSGSIGNSLFMSQASAAARSLGELILNRSGQILTLGNAVSVNAYTQSNGTVNLNGTSLNMSGAITFPANASNGLFIGSATSSVSISGSGTITNSFKMDQSSSASRSLYDLSFARTGQLLILGNNLEIINAITPSTGSVVTSNFLRLKADATRTGMVGVVGGFISGTITAECYAPGGYTGWTNLGPAGMTGLTVADWESQMFMTCYGCPYDENSAGGFFVSIQSFNESVSGSSAYVPLSYTTSLTNGRGYWVYSGTSQFTTAAQTYSTSGVIKTGNTVLAVTNSANTGYNLVSNPYPAPIDWDLVAADPSNTNIGGSVYFYNPDVGQTISYAAGVSNPSGYITNGIIPMGQGFYIQANANTNLVFRESHKSNQNTSANPLLRQERSDIPESVFRLSILGSQGDYDETTFRFHPAATDTFDRLLDARKLFQTPGYLGYPGSYSKYTSISSRLHSVDYSINSLSTLPGKNLRIPILVKGQATGNYTISALELQVLPPNVCVSLHDRLLNQNHDLRQGAYVCHIDDSTSTPRFELNLCTEELTTSDLHVTSSQEEQLKVYQRSGGIVRIKTVFNESKQASISILNTQGQELVEAWHFSGTENSFDLDLGHLSDRLVLLRLRYNDGELTKKIYLY